MNNKVFISGKITGDPNYAHKFEAASVVIRREYFFDRHGSCELCLRKGHFGFVPVDPTLLTLFDIPLTEFSWSVCMMVCLWHLSRCSYVYFLRDWPESRGARIEHKVARLLHKKIIYQ